MAFSDTVPTAEKKVKPLNQLELGDLQLVAVALVGLFSDGDIRKKFDKRSNSIQIELTEWLRRRGRETLADLHDPTLSIPLFYAEPEQIATIIGINDIDDFPLQPRAELTYMDSKYGVEMYHNDWQTCFLRFYTEPSGFARRRLDIAPHPSHPEHAWTDWEKISLYTSAWDSQGHFSPYMVPEGSELMAALAGYGCELQQPTSKD